MARCTTWIKAVDIKAAVAGLEVFRCRNAILPPTS